MTLQIGSDITRGLIQDLKTSSPVEGLTVYRGNGVEAFTDLETLRQVTREADLPEAVIASIQKMTREPSTVTQDPLFRRAVETLAPQEALVEVGEVAPQVLAEPDDHQAAQRHGDQEPGHADPKGA